MFDDLRILGRGLPDEVPVKKLLEDAKPASTAKSFCYALFQSLNGSLLIFLSWGVLLI